MCARHKGSNEKYVRLTHQSGPFLCTQSRSTVGRRLDLFLFNARSIESVEQLHNETAKTLAKDQVRVGVLRRVRRRTIIPSGGVRVACSRNRPRPAFRPPQRSAVAPARQKPVCHVPPSARSGSTTGSCSAGGTPGSITPRSCLARRLCSLSPWHTRARLCQEALPHGSRRGLRPAPPRLNYFYQTEPRTLSSLNWGIPSYLSIGG